MTMFVETREYAPEWLVKAIHQEFAAAVIIRMHDADPVKYPALRDRTDDARKMLVGFGDLAGPIRMKVFKGYELARLGWEVTGAMLAADIKLVWKADE